VFSFYGNVKNISHQFVYKLNSLNGLFLGFIVHMSIHPLVRYMCLCLNAIISFPAKLQPGDKFSGEVGGGGGPHARGKRLKRHNPGPKLLPPPARAP